MAKYIIFLLLLLGNIFVVSAENFDDIPPLEVNESFEGSSIDDIPPLEVNESYDSNETDFDDIPPLEVNETLEVDNTTLIENDFNEVSDNSSNMGSDVLGKTNTKESPFNIYYMMGVLFVLGIVLGSIIGVNRFISHD